MPLSISRIDNRRTRTGSVLATVFLGCFLSGRQQFVAQDLHSYFGFSKTAATTAAETPTKGGQLDESIIGDEPGHRTAHEGRAFEVLAHRHRAAVPLSCG